MQVGEHRAAGDVAASAGSVVMLAGTDELMSYYPQTVKDWIARKGGLTADMAGGDASLRLKEALVEALGIKSLVFVPIRTSQQLLGVRVFPG